MSTYTEKKETKKVVSKREQKLLSWHEMIQNCKRLKIPEIPTIEKPTNEKNPPFFERDGLKNPEYKHAPIGLALYLLQIQLDCPQQIRYNK